MNQRSGRLLPSGSADPETAIETGTSQGDHDGQIVLLQFLRGLAASGVVVEHLFERYARRGVMPHRLPSLSSNLGETGVAVFFAISGFLMVSISLRAGRPAPSGWSFFKRRFLRVAPLYYITTLLIVIFRWATHSVSTNPDFRLPTSGELVQTFLFIPHRGANGLIQPINQLGWTLHYEMFFYLLFAISLAVAQRRGAVVALAGLVALVCVGLWVDAPPDRYGLHLIAYVFTRPILLYFAFGMLVALVRTRVGPIRSGLPDAVLAAMVVGALIVAASELSGSITMAATIFALGLTVLPADRASSNGLVAVFKAFGDASYSIYLTHGFVLGAFAVLTAPLVARGFLGLSMAALLGCLLCFGVGWATWRAIERPIDNLLRGRSNGAATASSASRGAT